MAEESTEETKKEGGGKGLLVILVVLVLILTIAVGVGGYLLYSQGAFNPEQAKEEQKVEKKDGSAEESTFKADINDLVLNITNSKGRGKLMKLSFSVKSSEPTIAALVEEYKAEIIDVVIEQISARNADELLTVGGKNLLKDDLLLDLNKVIDEVTKTNADVKKNSIQKILFTSFVIK